MGMQSYWSIEATECTYARLVDDFPQKEKGNKEQGA
jgi:hypothetical protein